MTVIRKVTVAKAAGSELSFVLSDETKDRMGDVISASGWNLKNFQSNPIALFNHSSSFPIGFWKNVRVDGKRLIGDLTLAAEGTSDRIDEIRRLVDQGILRAVSVGFVPSKSEPLDKKDEYGGVRYLQQELVETSLVSVPANPAALQLARSLKVSDDTMALVFGEHAERDQTIRRGSSGEHAVSLSSRKNGYMTIAKQIEERQRSLVDLQDQLQTQVSGLDTADDAETATIAIEDLNARIEGAQKSLDALRKAETKLANDAHPIVVRDPDSGPGISPERRPFAAPMKQIKPIDQLVRMMLITGVAKALNRDPVQVMRERYGDDRLTKGVFDIVMRAASAPAMTNVTGWAQELVTTAFLDMIDTLIPQSVYPGLSVKGGRFGFGRNGIVSIPARTTSATVAGSFVGQGNPIPVRQGAFTATTLTVKKLAVITTFTREMAEHSTPQIEQVLRQAIMEDTSVAIDTVLLDNNPATAIRPAGIRNGVSGLTPTSIAGGALAALVADVKGLVGALITSTAGHLRAPVWIMNPVQVLSIQFMTNANGQFIFADEISQGRFRGYPLLVSTTVPATMVILVDAADFFSATGDTPNFNASDQATLHMEDTTPLAIGTVGAPATVAAPARSLFQTDSIGIRMTLDMNWALRRTGVVSWVTAVTW